jgi:hypothetical protein
MALLMVLALALTAEESAPHHVRTTDSKIHALIAAGISGSVTFRGLIATLNESDVIVYIVPKARIKSTYAAVSRHKLGGYFAHHIVLRGQFRYVRIAVEIAGAEHRLISLLAHELQHAVEVAQAPDARDAEDVELLFRRLALSFGCGVSNCFETKAAGDIQYVVREELAESRRRGQVRLPDPPTPPK